MSKSFYFKTSIKILLLCSGFFFLIPFIIIFDLKYYADFIMVFYAFIASAYFLHKRENFKDHFLFPYLIAISFIIVFGITGIIILFVGGMLYFGYEHMMDELIKWMIN